MLKPKGQINMKARLPKGYGGGPGNMNSMIKQAQKMQADAEALQGELETREYTAVSGGMVEVTVTGDHKIKSISIKPEAVDPDDVEMLEDLVLAAVNEALRQYEAASDATVNKIAGGMKLGF